MFTGIEGGRVGRLLFSHKSSGLNVRPVTGGYVFLHSFHLLKRLVFVGRQVVIAGWVAIHAWCCVARLLKCCTIGFGRLGTERALSKCWGQSLFVLKCWGQSWFASRNGGLSRKFTGCGLSRKLKMLGTELARFA